MKNKGFTLAEVLITLTIIGVVAAITIPNLLTSTQGKEYQTGAKKALATLSNAVTMRTAISGEDYEDFISEANLGNRSDLGPAIYLTCAPGAATNITNNNSTDDDGNNWVGGGFTCTRTGSVLPVTECEDETCKLKDGMTVQFNSVTVAGMNLSDNGVARPMGLVVFDTNGVKGPARQIGEVGRNNVCNSFMFDGIDYRGSTVARNNLNGTPNTNICPDIVTFFVDNNGEVIPSDQRTRNILATGNAMISR